MPDEKQSYKVLKPFRLEGVRYPSSEGDAVNTVDLTDEQAAQLQEINVISDEPYSPESDESKTSDDESTGSGTDAEGTDAQSNSAQQEDDTASKFLEAVNSLEKDNTDHWTNDGKPEVKALSSVGFKCTAAERNELWKQYQENNAS